MATEVSPTIKQDLTNPFIIGDDWYFAFRYSNSTNTAIDITNFTGELEVCLNEVKISGSPFALNLSTSQLDETKGEGVFIVPKTTTTTLDAGTYSYNIVLIDVFGIRNTYKYGYFTAKELC